MYTFIGTHWKESVDSLSSNNTWGSARFSIIKMNFQNLFRFQETDTQTLFITLKKNNKNKFL